MATTNAQQFNPSQANQETDAAYTTDVTRVNGAGVDAIWPSISANKTLYQVTTYVTALGQMMANKGFTNADTNLAALTTVMSNILMSSDLQSNLQLVNFSPSVVLNAAQFTGFELAMAGNMNITLTGLKVGQPILLMFVQDGVGGRTATIISPGVEGALQPDPTPGVLSVQLLAADATGFLHALTPMFSSMNGIVDTPIGLALPRQGSFTGLQATGANITGSLQALVATIAGALAASTLTAASATINGTLFAQGIDVDPGVIDVGTLNANAIVSSSGEFTELTAQTVGSTDISLNVANTAFVKSGLATSFANPGFLRLPMWMGSLIIQWGMTGPGGGSFVNFPIPFTANLFSIQLTPIFNTATDTNTRFAQVNVGATLAGFEPIISNGAPTTMCYYLAIGN